MKWYSPQVGDERTVKKFAWLPTYCGNGLMIWLEWYIAKQKYYRLQGWSNEETTTLKNN